MSAQDLSGPPASGLSGPAAPGLTDPAVPHGCWTTEAQRGAPGVTACRSLKQARLRHCHERRRQRRPPQRWAGTLCPAPCLCWEQQPQWRLPCIQVGPDAAQAGCCQSRPDNWLAGWPAAHLSFSPWGCHLAALAQPVGYGHLQAHDEAQAVNW